MADVTHLAISLVVACVLIGLIPASRAETITGSVIGVHDGDTITLLTSRDDTIRVRLAEIDAPELHQPGGMASKQALAALVYRRQVAVEAHGKDRYGRTIGAVAVAGLDAGLSMVKNGQAWAYRAYLPPDCRSAPPDGASASTGFLAASRGMCPILAAEQDAREHRRGLWRLQADQRIPPWEWRHEH